MARPSSDTVPIMSSVNIEDPYPAKRILRNRREPIEPESSELDSRW